MNKALVFAYDWNNRGSRDMSNPRCTWSVISCSSMTTLPPALMSDSYWFCSAQTVVFIYVFPNPYENWTLPMNLLPWMWYSEPTTLQQFKQQDATFDYYQISCVKRKLIWYWYCNRYPFATISMKIEWCVARGWGFMLALILRLSFIFFSVSRNFCFSCNKCMFVSYLSLNF